MCGIAGFRCGPDDRKVADSLLACLAHRGPDAGTWTTVGPWGLVHTRLAVIDLSDRVRYPLGNETGDLSLSFNGEIYNHRALRRELEAAGHRFSTDCDAEVVVHGWEEWGVELFARLSGMFAFALADRRSGELLLVRDRLGIKPLCVTANGRFAFASEAMALAEAGLVAPVVDPDAIPEFLAFHYVPPPRTGIAGVEHLEPGTALIVGPDGRRTLRWAPAPFAEGSSVQPVTLDELDEAFGRAVERHLVSDVDVGLMLSSGIDSSLLLERVSSRAAAPVCFTVGFPGAGDYDEAPAASDLARRYGAEHHVERLDVGFADAVEGVGSAFDGPCGDASAVATLAVARLASPLVKVLLSGTGGDDVFAGYYRHRAHMLRRALGLVPRPMLSALAARPTRRGGERSSAARLLASYAIRLAQSNGADRREQYLALVGSSTSPSGCALVRAAADPAAARDSAAGRLGFAAHQTQGWLRELQAFECRTYLPYDLLVKEDRATMAYGVESRVPLLDPELLALAERMPERQLISLRAGKRPLRALARRRIGPSRTVKRGFAMPLGPLLRGAWREEAFAWLTASGSTLVDGPGVAAELRAGRLEPADVWALSALMAWEERLARAGQGRAPETATPPLAR